MPAEVQKGMTYFPWGWASWKGCWRNLRWACRYPARFVRNVWRYAGWLATDEDFDWEFLAEVMTRKLRFMGDLSRDYGICERSGENAAECHEAADILIRLREEKYADRHGYAIYDSLTMEQKSEVWERAHADEAADRQRFGELMAKIQWWWE